MITASVMKELITFKKIQKQQLEVFYKKAVVNSEYIFESTYFEEYMRTAASENVHETDKKRSFIRNFYIYILYIKETSENVCFYFLKETSENASFFIS